MNFFKKIRKLGGDFFAEFSYNNVPKMAAALAYYTVFSLPALLIIIIWFTNFFYGQQVVEGKVYQELSNLIGKESAVQIQEVIINTKTIQNSFFPAIISIIMLVFGATGIFGEIQDSINQIWHLKADPPKGKAILKMLINRLLSFSMIAVLGFLLLVSLLLNSIMDVLFQKLSSAFSFNNVLAAYIFNFIFTFVIISILFGIIFKILPDAKIKWKDVRPGVIVTSVLFMSGKSIISYYLGHSHISITYGTAGSVIVILLWVYYSAIILYVGAVFTRVYALYRGSDIYPNRYAVWIEKREVKPDTPGKITT